MDKPRTATYTLSVPRDTFDRLQSVTRRVGADAAIPLVCDVIGCSVADLTQRARAAGATKIVVSPARN